MEETQVVSSLLVSFHTSPDLHIQRETTFRISFLSDYPETPPVVHLLVDGQCNDVLLDQYDDPRLDPSRRGTLYMLRICNPADGWMASSYTVECVIFALRWTLTKIQSPSAVCKITPTSRLGTLFDRDPHSKDGPLRPNANGAHLICSCLHHEEQGYRDSMEDVVLGLDESDMNGLVNRKHDLPYRLYAVFDGHGGDNCAKIVAERFVQHISKQEGFTKAAIAKDIEVLKTCECCSMLDMLMESNGEETTFSFFLFTPIFLFRTISSLHILLTCRFHFC